MSMQDNEMDELFRAKLDNMEVEPSERVWKGIVVELNGAQPKRTLMPVVRIAASITVFVAAGLFFLLKTVKEDDEVKTVKTVKIHTKTTIEKTDTTTPVINDDKTAADAQQIAVAAVNAGAVKSTVKVKTAARPVSKVLFATLNTKQSNGKANTQQATAASVIKDEEPVINQQAIAALTDRDVKVSQPVVPDEPLTAAKAVTTADDFKTADKPVLTRVAENKPAKPAKKHGIRSFGDLINVVVAKVDKREDKIIEFSNTDDDEATITGINLGIVKVKKDK